MRRAWSLWFTVAFAGCFGPDFAGDGSLKCAATAPQCPPGLQCIDGACWDPTKHGDAASDLAMTPPPADGGAFDLTASADPDLAMSSDDLTGAVPLDLTGTPSADLRAAADLKSPADLGALPDDPGPGPTETCTFTPDTNGFFPLTSSDGIEHIVRLPKKPTAYDTAAPQPYPLFVSLHGCGDTALNHATWSTVPWGTWRDNQNYIGLSVGGRNGACWNMTDDPVKVANAIAKVRACFYVHQKKIVIGGYSSGGMLAYKVGLTNAATYAGILIANSGIRSGLGGENKVTPALNAAAWKINIAQKTRDSDDNFPLADVLADKMKIDAAGFPYDFLQAVGEHGDVDGDWDVFLIPHIASWRAP